MGLDMYLFYTNEENVDSGEVLNPNFYNEICYWRKHPDLHGWMENLYHEKGGKKQFNCIDLILTIEDLNRLEQDIINDKLPHTEGFFFGSSSHSNESKEYDLNAIKMARDCINDGFVVYYFSWW